MAHYLPWLSSRPTTALLPPFKPHLFLRRGYWSVLPTGVWKQLNPMQKARLRAAHDYAAELNKKRRP